MIAGHMLRKKVIPQRRVIFTHILIVHDIEQNGHYFC